jgi:hypothetical protein
MKYMISSFRFGEWPFFSNFKWKCSFQISKMKFLIFLITFQKLNFQFFHFKILWHISIFSFPCGGMVNFFFKFHFKFQNCMHGCYCVNL